MGILPRSICDSELFALVDRAAGPDHADHVHDRRPRPCRRPDRRSRHLRHRRGVSPVDQAAAQELRDPRGPRRDRRDVGPVPLPRHPLGLRPAYVRLRVQAMDRRQGDRRRRVDPRLHPRDRRRERDHASHPLQPQGARRVVVLERGALDRPAQHGDNGERRRADLRRAVLRVGLLRLRRRLHAHVHRRRGLQRPDRPSPALARGSRLRRQARGRHRQRGDRRDARAGDGRQGRSRDDAAALAELRARRARQGPDRQRPARGSFPTRSPTG